MTAPAEPPEPDDAAERDADAEPTAAAESGPAAQPAGRPDATVAASDDLAPHQRAARVHRMGRRVPLIAGGIAVAMGALLGLVIAVRAGGLPLGVDEEWSLELAEAHSPAADVFALFMNMLGGGIVGVILVPVGITIALLVLRRPWAALYFALASAGSALVVQVLKELYGRPRPEDMMVTSDFGSFPSGHVANAATIAVALGVIVPRVWVWVAGAVYTVLMAISRTYLGVHWLTDTIGGALVGAGVALLLWAAFAVPLERERLARLARASERNAALAQAHVTPPSHPRPPR
ncbi:phosphatase PAP2 family protein [Agromyces allii]|uniref:Phosphatidic acid phosphatase type 2/haloperoxidase domain-containing protein n=1 Tax=Agromyces allii TaxID=393607 RepID=A0ABN2R0U3_9MICO|nr:phosphatase PAP2 family protein [Agromyces allii]